MDTHRSIEFHSIVFVYYDFDVDYDSLIDSYRRRSLYRIIYMIPFMNLVYSIIESAGVIYYFVDSLLPALFANKHAWINHIIFDQKWDYKED